MAPSTLSQLSKLIAESVAAIEASCAARGVEVPSIDSAFTPGSEAFRMDPAVAEAINIATASAYQMAALLEPPPVSVSHIASGHYKAIALRALLETNTIEILREAGPKGIHVDEIAKRNQLDPKKNARLLRYLSTYYMFREVEPDVFANTRISSMLDTGKSVDELLAKPHDRHVGTPGFAALIEHVLDEGWMGATSAVATLRDPKTRFSGEPTDAPLARTTGSNVPFWVWIEQPGQEMRLQRFGIAMQGVVAMQPAEAAIGAGFDWKALGPEDVVVDVGAGVGAVSLALAKSFPSLKIVVQDRDAVIEQAKGVWAKELPDAVQSGRVKLQGHDFFAPQPVKRASVFLLKQILHDWSDSYAVKILKQLRASATPNTKLVVMESIVPYACRDTRSAGKDGIPGAVPPEAPEPLLANFGPINDMQYNSDFTMFFLLNSQERTIGHFSALLQEAGWNIIKVYRGEGPSAFMQQIEAVPV